MTYYIPSCRDVLHVSSLLVLTPLPTELIDVVLEWAEYWPRITARSEETGPATLTRGSVKEHARLLRVPPICSGAVDEGQYIRPSADERRFYRRPAVWRGLSKEALHDEDDDAAAAAAGDSGVSALWSGAMDLFRRAAARIVDTDSLGSFSRDRNTKSAPASDEGNASHAGSRAAYYAELPPEAIMEPRRKHPVRRIIWRLRSKDQGWGGEGGDVYENSWTGFRGRALRLPPAGRCDAEGQRSDEHSSEGYAERFDETAMQQAGLQSGEEGDHDVWPQGGWSFQDTHIQLNRRANKECKDHFVVWDHRDDIQKDDPRAITELRKVGRGICTGDGSFVQALSGGDIIELWSFAFFPGWANHVEVAEVTVEFAL